MKNLTTTDLWSAAFLGAALVLAACGTSHPVGSTQDFAAPSMQPRSAYDEVPSSKVLPDGVELAQEEEGNREAYDSIQETPFLRPTQAPLSTFAADVDTASYSNVRRFLNGGNLPPAGAVRVEELLNYFPYDYAQPEGGEPLAIDAEVFGCPWKPDHRLLRVGVQGRRTDMGERPAANLVFLLDVSGSMGQPDKLPLLKRSLEMLIENLDERDRVAVVVYAGASGVALPSTSCDSKDAILAAIERLEPSGSTNGGAGIRLAYDIAREHFVPGGVNRVLLATDGDFNVGTSSRSELVRLIEKEAASKVYLTVLGFGQGNLQDATMQDLANRGNGHYAYIDSVLEARKVLVEELGSTLEVIARDVKIQVEFNPLQVAGYRLIGYENRRLADRDFADDSKDAGEIGAGHRVTALYEIVPAGRGLEVPGAAELKYQQERPLAGAAFEDEVAHVKLRYQEPEGDAPSRLFEFPVRDEGTRFDMASTDARFASAVAAFGLVLRESNYCGDTSLAQVRGWAGESLGEDEGGYRLAFLELVETAAHLRQPER